MWLPASTLRCPVAAVVASLFLSPHCITPAWSGNCTVLAASIHPMCFLPLCSGHTTAYLAYFLCQIQNIKHVIWHSMVPLKINKGQKIPQTTIVSSCNGVLLLLSRWDLSQGVGTFPIVHSVSIFALGEHCNSEWVTEEENTLVGLALNMLSDSKSNILGVLCNEDCWVGFSGWKWPLSHQLIDLEKADTVFNSAQF